MTEPLTATLDRLVEVLRAQGAPVVDLFRPPLKVPQSVPGLHGKPLVLASSVAEMYGWHDGTTDIGGAAYWLFPMGWWFQPFDTAMESLRGLIDELDYSPEMPYWRESWFPVLQAGLEVLAVDCASGEVWSSSISTGEAFLVAPSLDVFFARVISAFESGVFRVDDGAVVQADEDQDEIELLKGD